MNEVPQSDRGDDDRPIQLTQLKTKAWQWLCKPHRAMVTATPKPTEEGWWWTKPHSTCGVCTPDDLRPDMAWIEAALTNGNGVEPHSATKAASASSPEPEEPGAASGSGTGHTDSKPSTNGRGSMLPYAIAYARRGFRIFPVHEIEADNECSCGERGCSSAGKHPRFSGWQESATTDEDQIREWWRQWPSANIGVKCGRDSNLTVLDVDGEEGRETLQALELERGELPETPVAITGSGGAHYYFAFEEGPQNKVKFAPGLDIRSEGGLVVGVGSKTKRKYEWEAAFALGDELLPARMPKVASGPDRRGECTGRE